jgi:ABC-type transport system substrate-binding protein
MRLMRARLAALILAVALPAHAADPAKILRVAFDVDPTGFDPQAANDTYSSWICRGMFDTLLEYDYLKRPYALKPSSAQSLPEIRDGGRTLVFKIKPGIHFAPDPVFRGKPRELVAADYVYSWKRLLDPRMRSFWGFYLDDKLVGADEVVAAARASGKFDYDARLEGLQALDRYTLQVKLKEPDYLLIERMTTMPLAAVAREVIEAYGTPGNGWTMDHPVGTGPFMLKEWRRGSKVVLVANPGYRDDRFPTEFDTGASAALRANAGKRLPLVGQVEINVIEEANPRLLAFDAQQIDYLWIPYSLVDRVIESGSLRPEYERRGVRRTRVLETAFTYTYFNMDDPTVGGYSPDRVALRRAIAMAYDVGNEIRVLRQGEAIPATQMVPPGLLGHDPKQSRRSEYNPAAAGALLDKFGYKRAGPGSFRTMPDGSPLVLKLGSSPSSEDREFDELWKRSMDAVGIRIEFIKQKWPDLLKMSTAGQLQMFRLARFTQLRDGSGLLEILYSKNIGTGMNDSHFRLPEFDRLFERARALPDSPERNALYARMSEITAAYMPIMIGTYRYRTVLSQPWVLGLRADPFFREPWKYLDVDRSGRKLQERDSAASARSAE